MKVTLIAHTQLVPSRASEGPPFVTDQWLPRSDDNDDYYEGHDADWLAEVAGRLCYKSFDRPNVKTARNEDYIANIIKQQHFSVLEHASASFLIEDVSRSLTHELVRHRHFSFSQVSQRYVDHSEALVVIPPVISDLPDPDAFDEISEALFAVSAASEEAYVRIYDLCIANGLSRKQARGAARAALLESTETSLVVTGNHRSWREFVQKRNSPAADQEIHDLASLLLDELKIIAPATYQDFP